jgi:hypothetical protein
MTDPEDFVEETVVRTCRRYKTKVLIKRRLRKNVDTPSFSAQQPVSCPKCSEQFLVFGEILGVMTER